MSAPGRFELVSDSGWSARFTLGASERLDDVRIAPLPRPKGHPRSKASTDAESLFVDAASGRIWIGLEGINQIWRSEEHTSELQSLMRISYAVFCLKKKK